MLSDAKVRNARAAAKPYRLSDGDGLHLSVPTTRTRVWQLRTQTGGKELLRTPGHYADMSRAQARQQRDQVKSELTGNATPDPGAVTLKRIARDRHPTQAPRWKPRHAADVPMVP